MGSEGLLLGRGRRLEVVAAEGWRRSLLSAAATMTQRLAFMTADHRRIREESVLRLPANRLRPLTVSQLSRVTSLSERTVDRILRDLHRHLFFLVRNRHGDVGWAFPVTVDRTPHLVEFSSGERLWGA